MIQFVPIVHKCPPNRHIAPEAGRKKKTIDKGE